MFGRNAHFLQKAQGNFVCILFGKLPVASKRLDKMILDGKDRVQSAARILESDSNFSAANSFPFPAVQRLSAAALEQNLT